MVEKNMLGWKPNMCGCVGLKASDFAILLCRVGDQSCLVTSNSPGIMRENMKVLQWGQ